MRWNNLVRHGLLSTSIVGAAAAPASARPCEGTIVGFTIGFDFAPKASLVGGLESRQCLGDTAEAMFRIEAGGGGLRLIVGSRARLFEKEGRVDDWGDFVGVEAGLAVELLPSRIGDVGVHLALSYGYEAAYFELQGLFPVDDHPNRGALVGGFAPSQTYTHGTPGRPVSIAAQVVVPDVLAFAVATCVEDRAVNAHFIRAAQLEYSSVWTFLRLAAELAAVGAPAELVARALDAADDEVRHAELCARAAGGLALAQLPMIASQPRFKRRSPHALAVIAAEAWREGCLNEGAAAEEARLASDEAQGATRAMLGAIATDEAMHAELAWDVLAWIHAVAPDSARLAIAIPPENVAVSVEDPALARRGVARSEVRRAALADSFCRAAERVCSVTAV